MEDSGFDSGDVKPEEQDENTPINRTPDAQASPGDSDNNGSYIKPARNAAFLQKRIEKRIEQAKKSHSTANGAVDQQPRKSLMSINRLNVPNKLNIPLRDGAEQPLVMWQSDSSEDEYEFLPAATYHSAKEMSKQLHKNSFNSDLKPSDEDLDLIPPRAFNQHCICCQWSASTCSIQ